MSISRVSDHVITLNRLPTLTLTLNSNPDPNVLLTLTFPLMCYHRVSLFWIGLYHCW